MEVHVVRSRVAISSNVIHLAGVLGICLDEGVEAVVGQMTCKGRLTRGREAQLRTLSHATSSAQWGRAPAYEMRARNMTAATHRQAAQLRIQANGPSCKPSRGAEEATLQDGGCFRENQICEVACSNRSWSSTNTATLAASAQPRQRVSFFALSRHPGANIQANGTS